jgi:hypothetical protein
MTEDPLGAPQLLKEEGHTAGPQYWGEKQPRLQKRGS